MATKQPPKKPAKAKASVGKRAVEPASKISKALTKQDPDGLNPRQRRFVQEYIKDLNATSAYKRAGYSYKNESTAATAAWILLRNLKVNRVIAKLQAKVCERKQLTAEMVLDRIMREADLEEPLGTSTTRLKALEMLCRHLGLFMDKVTVSGDAANPIQVNHSVLGVITSDDDRRTRLARLVQAAAARKLELVNGGGEGGSRLLIEAPAVRDDSIPRLDDDGRGGIEAVPPG